ncbi:MAG: transposase [Candidatus Komeilibacteria bacterium]|nr:transposase [Candidatus Komeilibacteria bacterium]
MSLFKNTYRIESIRLLEFDYSTPGYYSITICTKDRENYFGEINNCKMKYSPIGLIARKFWLEIPKHYPFIELAEFIVMPNHVHGIIIINDFKSVETHNCASLQKISNIHPRHYNKFGLQSKNLAAIIRAYKSTVKKYANEHDIEFNWQPRYYEHIIRDNDELNRIREYIKNNPLNWKTDRNNI